MEIEKLQRYLKNRHKFDRKKDVSDTVDDFNKFSKELIAAIQKDNNEELEIKMGQFLIELLKLSNAKDFDIVEILRDKMKFNV